MNTSAEIILMLDSFVRVATSSQIQCQQQETRKTQQEEKNKSHKQYKTMRKETETETAHERNAVWWPI